MDKFNLEAIDLISYQDSQRYLGKRLSILGIVWRVCNRPNYYTSYSRALLGFSWYREGTPILLIDFFFKVITIDRYCKKVNGKHKTDWIRSLKTLKIN